MHNSKPMMRLLLYLLPLLVLSIFACNSSKEPKTSSKQQQTPAIAIPQADLEAFLAGVDSSYQQAEKWFRNSLRTKGLFRYSHYPLENKYSEKNNAIRQLMGTRLLAELCQKDTSWCTMHRKNMDFLLKYWYKEKDTIGYIKYNKKSKLGANAMMVRAMVVSPFYDEYALKARRLINSMLVLTEENGALNPFYIEPAYSYNKDYLLTFYSGEALVAYIEYALHTGDKEMMNIAKKSQDFYIDRYVTNLEEHYYPAYVPWHTLSLNKLYHITKDKRYADAIFTLTDKLLEIQDTTNFVGRFYNPKTPEYGKPHSASDGVYTEGLAYAFEVAILEGDAQRQKTYFRALQFALQHLRSLQYTAADCEGVKFPQRCEGAFRTSDTNPWARTDNGQHIMDGYRKLLDARRLNDKTGKR